MWVYVRSEPGLWTVGFHSPDGDWHTDSDHGDQQDAAKRAAWLNGDPAAEAPQPRVLCTGTVRDYWTNEDGEYCVLVRMRTLTGVGPAIGKRIAVIEDTETPPNEVTHACPSGDAAFTPCCGRTPFELPRADRLTLDPDLVTCRPVHEDTETPPPILVGQTVEHADLGRCKVVALGVSSPPNDPGRFAASPNMAYVDFGTAPDGEPTETWVPLTDLRHLEARDGQ